MKSRLPIHAGLLFIVSGTFATAGDREIPDFAVKQPMHPTMRQYYESTYRKPYLDVLLKSYGSAEKFEAAARYDSTKSTAFVLVPSAWQKADTGWGLYLHVSPTDNGYLPNDWDTILAREKLIGVSPHGIGNDAEVALRMRLALDAVAAARTEFRLDDKRIFVGGFSGGASIAARLVVEFPDLFRGAVAECRALPLLDVPAEGGVYPGEYKDLKETTWAALRGYGRRWYFGTGRNDFNYASVTAQAPIWRRLGLETLTDVVGDHDHRDLPAASFEKALSFIQGVSGKKTPPSVAKTDGVRKPVRVSGSVFWLIPHGTSTALGDPGRATVFILEGKDARKELATRPIAYVWNAQRHGLEGKYEFKDLALPAQARLVVEYAMNADLDDGNGMRTQTESVVPVWLPNKSGAELAWKEAQLKAKKGRESALKGKNGK